MISGILRSRWLADFKRARLKKMAFGKSLVSGQNRDRLELGLDSETAELFRDDV